ncbi:MAG TPA: DNA/RNA nuclease SfsA [Gammaproteobacteria bacterium]|nr:DNA/RNA nuclease SfsA [Gammaproteobacteria bacterium]
MRFETPLIPATLLRRYKRFLADVRLDDGREVTVHTPNTGAMTGCAEPGSRIWLRDTGNPDRKYPLAWELSTAPDGVLVGVNTHLANRLVREGIDSGIIDVLRGYSVIRQEVRYGEERSRIDLLLQEPGRADCYVEIKSVTLVRGEGEGAFPDAVSARGAKHLRELAGIVRGGDRAVLLFCVQRGDARVVRPAADIDPLYARTLAEAHAAGVEVYAWRASVSPEAIVLDTRLPVEIP